MSRGDSADGLKANERQTCCLPHTKIGSLNENSLEDIWSGPLYAAFRLRVNSDNPPDQRKSSADVRKPGNVHSYLTVLTSKDWVAPYDWES